ncbi:hypothetical protein CN507_07490 [Bacillus cereus]|nr:hypothetical protein CN507_07490 [Bacillus cereus]
MGCNRIAKELGIKVIIGRKKPHYEKKETYVTSNNYLHREFQNSKPNEKWVTDITYLIFNGQRLYLLVIKPYTTMKLLLMKSAVGMI